ncbi:hypothetical protein BDBG_03734 [Blastomyces gilchristii SLH14081]|uniref:Uncharacterized protein n=1 Tax=Blastomyces gilchristii (strain SLH14081) TaxID=559298 RepID=A0A179UI22_BLAGS|nr:uncharacterized protein BDBG_03734 [Blastomyces gilchristii SLH14081]OAT07696.1 hypothetical protein BDBG_03734 [Blastomyces gilchristii SLH14081]
MLSSESKLSQASTTIRNLTYFHNRSPSQLPHCELPFDSTYGDNRSSIDAPPTISTFRPSLNTTTHPKIEANTAAHRRAKTETFSLPGTRPHTNGNEHLNRLDEVNLEPNTEQKITSPKSSRPATLFTGLFQGESAPIRFGLVRSYAEEATTNNTDRPNTAMEMTESLPPRAQRNFTKRVSMPSPLKQVSSSARFSFFGPRPQSQDSTRGQLPEPADDEFLNLDVSSVLFPSGSTDLPAPEALKSLQYNAERVIGQLQAAYKLRTFALHEALAEKSSLGEELEETQSRLLNIKNQLNGMAEKVDEQDKAMKAMAEELKLERQKRQENEEEEARKRSIVLVREPEPAHYQDHSHHRRCSCAAKDGSRDGPETMSTKRHSKRSSCGTFYSDSGFESGDESTTESIFSRKYENLGSPSTLATRASGASSPDIGFSITPLPSLSEDQLAPPRPQPQPQQSTVQSKPAAPATKPSAYDRVLRGISSANLGASFMSSSPFSTSRCSNCHGATASDAWGVVSVLKEENRGLKNRIGELEAAVDECITLVGG